MLIGKALKNGKPVFCKTKSDGSKVEVKRDKDGTWKEVGVLPAPNEAEKKAQKIKLQIKAAEIRGDEARKAELEAKLAELS